MRRLKIAAVLLLSGVLLGIGSCVSAIGYYLLQSLPDLLTTLTQNSTTSA